MPFSFLVFVGSTSEARDAPYEMLTYDFSDSDDVGHMPYGGALNVCSSVYVILLHSNATQCSVFLGACLSDRGRCESRWRNYSTY